MYALQIGIILYISWDGIKMTVSKHLYLLDYFSAGRHSFYCALFNLHQGE